MWTSRGFEGEIVDGRWRVRVARSKKTACALPRWVPCRRMAFATLEYQVVGQAVYLERGWEKLMFRLCLGRQHAKLVSSSLRLLVESFAVASRRLHWLPGL